MIDWIKLHSNKLSYVAMGVVLVVFVAFKFRGNSTADYIKAGYAFSQWIKDPQRKEDFFKQIEKRRALSAKYGVALASKLRSEGGHLEAKPYLIAALKRTEGMATPYARYAKTSLLLEEGNNELALKEALQLKQEVAASSLLYGYNLLRIAHLEKKAASWKELQEWKKAYPAAAEQLTADFQQGDLNLWHYVTVRQNG